MVARNGGALAKSSQAGAPAKAVFLKPRSRRQFCSRLVARAYARAGIRLVGDEDY